MKASANLSVVLPVHANNPYLHDAIISVLNQSHPHFELLVVVNGKDEMLAETLRHTYLADTRVKILYTPIPSLPFALNIGIASASTNIIVRMDSDDICETERLNRIHHTFQFNPDIDVLASACSIIDEHGATLLHSKSKAINDSTLRLLMPFRCPLRHPTVAFRRDLVLSIGGYSFGAFSEDYDLWLRLRRNTNVQFHTLGDSLLRYRRHTGQATTPKNNLKIFAYDFSLKIREFFLTLNPVFFAGAVFSTADLFYKYLAHIKFLIRKGLATDIKK